jgi:HD-GYP domain-containing protein (c-di-GMP phosphodiesterase class II)
MGGSTSYIHLRFAALSFVLVLAIGVLAVLAARSVISSSEQEAAATSASRLFSAPLRTLFAEAAQAGGLTPAQEEEASALAAAFVPSDALALRVYTPSGEELFATGGAPDAQPPSATSGVSGGFDESVSPPLFATAINEGAFVAQIVEDAQGVKSIIAERQRTALLTTILAVGLLFLLLQGAFWLVVRAISSDHQRLVRLYVAGESLRSTLDVEQVLAQLTRDATTTVGGQYGLVALYDHDAGDLILRSTYERTTGTISSHQRNIEEWFMRRCVITNTTIINAQAADAFQQIMPAVPGEGEINVLCVPMTIRDHVVGVVTVLHEATHRKTVFARNDVRQVVDLATQGAMAIEQAQLFAKVRTYAEQVELSYDSTLKALTAALDAKDDVTEGHCERVAKLTGSLASQLGIEGRALVDLERGALLHDVGKIGVPDEVLKKPSALNDMEWEAIRKHPLLAGVMISKVGFLEGTTPVLLYHHERYDGRGYPFGLSGDQIPLDARIFSVVDAYDAMTSDRPYRQAMPHRDAMREIGLHSGSQFDPAIVREFQRLMNTRPDLHARASGAITRARHDDDQPHLAESVA